MLRVMLDANLLISFLLSGRAASPPVQLVDAAFARRFVLLLPEEVGDEVLRRTTTKRYLARRLATADVERLLAELSAIAEELPRLGERAAERSRDPKDDYLLAQAIAAQADYLVTGDKDLLVLGTVEGVEIVSPASFLAIIG